LTAEILEERFSHAIETAELVLTPKPTQAPALVTRGMEGSTRAC